MPYFIAELPPSWPRPHVQPFPVRTQTSVRRCQAQLPAAQVDLGCRSSISELRESGHSVGVFEKGTAAYKRKVILFGEAPMAKASPSRPRTQRAQKSKAQEASPETRRDEGAEQPAFIKSLESLNIG